MSSFDPSAPLAWQRKPSTNRRWLAGGAVLSVLALSYLAWPSASRASSTFSSWTGSSGSELAVQEAPSDPSKPCEKTLVLDWDSWSIGIGSGMYTLTGAAIWAEDHGYEVLVSKGKNNYGQLSEYFSRREPTCLVEDDMAYDPWKCRDGKDGCSMLFNYTTGELLSEELPKRTGLGVWSLYPVNPANRWISQKLFDFKSLEGLPAFDSQKPLPRYLSIPPALQPAYTRMQNTFNRYFTLNAAMEEIVEKKANELDLQKPTHDRVPVIGVHFRAGDKMVYECRPTSQMSCANVTLHLEGALDQLHAAQERSTYLKPLASGANKPKLVLLTAEADAFANFTRINNEKFGGVFEIVKAPDVNKNSKDKSFKQQSFNSLPLEARIADAQDLLSNVAMLARRADGFVVSGNTNIGRVASLMSNRPMAVTNIDFNWHPTLFLLSYPKCNGLGVCIPG
ncbi:hypothetical protein JCM8547_005052 [Rhodosporidiobolus lusitaniae]